MNEWVSILPPLLAIAVAIWKKEVIIALVLGIWFAETILLASDPLAWRPDNILTAIPAMIGLALQGVTAAMDRIAAVFESGGNTRVLLFGLLVGALLELMRDSGGVAAFVDRLSRIGLTKTKRQVGILSTVIGMLIFVETSMSVLSAGVVSQNLFDRFKMSRARLAYIIDSTCAPISVLVVLNGWGAYILGLLEGYGLEQPVSVLAGSIPYNFYALITLVLVWYTAVSTKVYGPMARVENDEVESDVIEAFNPTKARYMVVPLAILVGGMVFFMWYTGNGSLLAGSGSKSVLWAVFFATATLAGMLLFEGVYSHEKVVELSYQGMAKLLPVVLIMLLSFAIGAACKDLGTGRFVAGAVGGFLPPILVAPLLFVCAALISFTTGTSWGTFAILIPVGIPLGLSMDLPPAFVLSAVLGGGVFGDHCSPISDTTLLSSLASGCDHLQHVRTQLPYAMVGAVAAITLYLVVGAVI